MKTEVFFAFFTPLSSPKDFPSTETTNLKPWKLSEYFRFQTEMQYNRNIPLIQQGLYEKVQKSNLFSSYFILISRSASVLQMQCWRGTRHLIFLTGLKSQSTQTSRSAMETKKLASLTETTLASLSGIKMWRKRPNMAWDLDIKHPICQSGWPLSTTSGEFFSILGWISWSRIGKHSRQQRK